jgi:capsid protein
MSTFTAGTANRAFADWSASQDDPQLIWVQEGDTIAARALSLACNDPFAAAMANAFVQGIHGPAGLQLESQYDSQQEESETTDEDRDIRREINAMIADTWFGTDIDAGGQLTRREIERQASWSAFVLGNGFGVRVWKPNRAGSGFSSTWRLVAPHRVSNMDGRPNDSQLRDGIELDANGVPVALHVEVTKVGSFGVYSRQEWKRIPWFAPDGTPNVFHRRGLVIPGMYRAISMLAPMIFTMRQTQGVVEAHVLGKRIQAMFPLIFQVEDPEKFRQYQQANAVYTPGMKLGPTSSVVISKDDAITFPEVKYDGSDVKDFMHLVWREQCASVGFPLEVVLAMMGDASLASARASLDQFDRTCQGYQEDAISQVTQVIDRARIAEAMATGEIDIPNGMRWSAILAGEYRRPPKYSTDRLKDANTVIQLQKAGVSGSTAFKMIGLSYESEREMVASEKEFNAAQGLSAPAEIAPDPTTQETPPVNGQPDTSTQNEQAAKPATGDLSQ